MKKLIRGLLKIPLTPFVLIGLLVSIIFTYFVSAYDWLYETDEYNRILIKNIREEYFYKLRKWFTTV